MYRFVDRTVMVKGHPVNMHILIRAPLGTVALDLALVIVGSLLLLYVFLRYFFKQAGDFAEEL